MRSSPVAQIMLSLAPREVPMDTNGEAKGAYVVKCACTFRVQTESIEEARQKALGQVVAAGASSAEVDYVLLDAPAPGEPVRRGVR